MCAVIVSLREFARLPQNSELKWEFGAEVEVFPAPVVQEAEDLVFLGVADVVPGADEFHQGAAVAFFETVETVPRVFGVGLGTE